MINPQAADDSATAVLWRYLRHEKGLELSLVESEDLDDMVADVIDEARKPYVAENQRLREQMTRMREACSAAGYPKMVDDALAVIAGLRVEVETLRSVAESKGYSFNSVAETNRLRAERDAALAKLEKVRAIVDELDASGLIGVETGRAVDKILAILDAPAPEQDATKQEREQHKDVQEVAPRRKGF